MSNNSGIEGLKSLLGRVESLAKEHAALTKDLRKNIKSSVDQIKDPSLSSFRDDALNALDKIQGGDVESAKEFLKKNGYNKEI